MIFLYLLRHAKSSWDDPGLADHERPLAARGERAARRMAEIMARDGIAPELVLCSSARRARDTLTRVAVGIPSIPDVRVEDELYAASARSTLARLRRVPDSVKSVMVVGHNPGLQELALWLLDPPGRARVGDKLPTGALAALQLDVPSWNRLRRRSATLQAVIRPRDA